MANLVQQKILEGLSGFLLVDKPAGIAFTTVVKSVKRNFGLVKVGHGGSLDAQASGLLVLLIGDANRLVENVMGADREYTGTLQRGETTDTGDAWGRPIPLPSRLATLDDLRGDVFQVEPRFCAIRKEGTADYEVVDTGEHTQFLAHVYRFDVQEDGAFALRASKGVLVRALAQDMGATLTSLRRTKVGSLSVADAIPFDRLLEIDRKDFAACVRPASAFLP